MLWTTVWSSELRNINKLFIAGRWERDGLATMVSRMNKWFMLTPAVLGLLGVFSAIAQQPESPNIGHTRHHHARNEAHPTEAPTSARFITSRKSDVVLPLPQEKDAFTFVVFGDRTGGPVDGVSVLADAVRDTNLLEPDLVITVGDLINGYNETPLWMEQMREYKAIMDKLICPWFPVAGNHDVYWRDRDNSGDSKPVGEHDSNYEMHFGPLWYAFEHKNSWFIALYSDETNPATGEKNFGKPENHKMTPEQFNWLKETLQKAKGADHVFLFLHHPRWIGGNNYGESWQPVHELLKEAGNVTAVFAGHIHQMRYDPKDGIEYVTLATVGGGQSGRVPEAGYLHQYHVITVRKQQVAMAAYPVGEAMDVREMTGDMVKQSERLAESPVTFNTEAFPIAADMSVNATVKVKVTNPTDRPAEFTVAGDSNDSRWAFFPDHNHKVLPPNSSHEFSFDVIRDPSAADHTYRPAEFVVDAEYLAPSHRYAMPTRRVPLPLDLSKLNVSPTSKPMSLHLDGDGDALVIPGKDIALPGNTLTLEGRFRASKFAQRNGLIAKTQSSNYGIFVSNGVPHFSVFVGDSYLAVTARDTKLDANRWYHIAGVYDGNEVRLYLDGKLIGSAQRQGAVKVTDLALVIGGDVDGASRPVDTFAGEIDDVRLSSTVRYTGETVTPQAATADSETLLLMDFQRQLGQFVLDGSAKARKYPLTGSAAVRPSTN